MKMLSSIRSALWPLALVNLLAGVTILSVGCSPGLRHVRKGLATDPTWKETQQAQPAQKDTPVPVVEVDTSEEASESE
ncbi:MAG: hypothetical protein A2289_23350 [Deltaproteobacteria bacterium RIFOXYA12_FULL_58_15]|nr:MAG: hypothetical protein A2289_23350 [Deltaproteobacteria bacterium RIFOXYA12_FULL_58_15]OGR13291.1 MAG: hypothetical protein A2341_16145 [Deltaproteobacteria bacterium RIFOXYB12_FULL_58_9]